MALGSTQPLTEMSTRSISWGKGGRCLRLTTLPPSCAFVMKSGKINFLEPSGPHQACNGTFRSTLYIQFFGKMHRLCCLLSTGVTGRLQTAESVHFSKNCMYSQSAPWRWAKLSPETCRASLKESIKQILLHLSGFLTVLNIIHKICFIDSFKLALHVSGDSFAHLEEHFIYTIFRKNAPTVLFTVDRCHQSAADSRVGAFFQKKSCMYSQSAPEDGRNCRPKHVEQA